MTMAPQQSPIPLQIQIIFPLSQSGPPFHCTHPHPRSTWRAEARRSLWFIEKRGGEMRGMRERERKKERPVTMATAATFITSLLLWRFQGSPWAEVLGSEVLSPA